ncbi:PREDICTED: sperm-tail PG-rich repeat-containing protein 2-like [Nicrophorus vespilloides]|uniref:Sperm-tail PG-rich repeat-containing protein 2-like n=1 Tax=Nicrophorus vespilloides TaxID=110193 RepID=A0ABM1MVE5_NICVS|nr:PREDICTED: sperm-tail PG-rich repeat-containing protein 2-like [Nicrophorus vespilloides]
MNLSPRWKKIIAPTPEKLAPNTYYVTDDGKFCKKNWVPFMQSSEKKLSIINKVYTEAIYDGVDKHRIVGGSTLRNKAIRETKVLSDSPGPGTYDPKPIRKKIPKVLSKTAFKGRRLYVCPVPYALEDYGPSIPTRIDENGYDINENDKLEKIPANKHDTTMGPAYYKVSTACTTTEIYKGCTFWKSGSRRGMKYESDTPSPGEYDARIKKLFNVRDEYVREMARLYSYVPRFVDAEQKKQIRADMPGPAAYTMPEKISKKSLSLNPAPFCTRKERFQSKFEENPGPAKYDIRANVIRNSFSLSDAPFSINSNRFITKKVLPTPGPGNYYLESPIIEKLLKKMNLQAKNIPFNHTLEREVVHLNKDVLSFPTASAYTVEPYEMEKSNIDAAVFKSKTTRFVKSKAAKTAEPASYSVSEPFNKNRDRKSHNTGKVPFQSTQPRQGIPMTGARLNPSPANYMGHVSVDSKGYYFNVTPRFADEPEDTPGPASYTFHPSLDTSTYKAIGTHNLRLKENVMRAKLQLPPSKTRAAWMKERKKKKSLKAFYKPPPQAIKWITFE